MGREPKSRSKTTIVARIAALVFSGSGFAFLDQGELFAQEKILGNQSRTG
jgi:hypothetical protein